MHHFHYKKTDLYCEDVPLSKIAQEVGTPCYVYSHATLSRHFQVFDQAFDGLPHLVCFAMKANSNIAILRSIVKMGGGIDIVSGGELFRARTAGAPADRIVYSGVGKTREEMAYALQEGILQFNVESEAELYLLDEVARSLGKKAPVSFRVNPDINPRTHPYISTGLKKSKFGIPITESLALYEKARQLAGIRVQGLSCHIGSQITILKPFREALEKMGTLVKALRERGFEIRHFDFGGGLGIPYKNEKPPLPKEYGTALKKELKALGCRILFEPGRVIVGNAGVLVTQVLYKKAPKNKKFVVVDAAMNDLIRPALYGSYHEILPVTKNVGMARHARTEKVDVVGPVCESGDFFAESRSLPRFEAGDLLAVMSAGAYGSVMASNYNSRPLVPEVMVKGDEYFVIRKRQQYKDLMQGEHVPKFLI
ncbi:MAG: diaminopimelate decarboxylase [Deltaproteobacteria bacterium]|nr:diaminopimelate decarboxylase [Deltaproteobacteria bacterium]